MEVLWETKYGFHCLDLHRLAVISGGAHHPSIINWTRWCILLQKSSVRRNLHIVQPQNQFTNSNVLHPSITTLLNSRNIGSLCIFPVPYVCISKSVEGILFMEVFRRSYINVMEVRGSRVFYQWKYFEEAIYNSLSNILGT